MTIWDRDRRGVNEFIGGIRLGPDPLACSDSTEWMDSIGDEVTHWEAAFGSTWRVGGAVAQSETFNELLESKC